GQLGHVGGADVLLPAEEGEVQDHVVLLRFAAVVFTATSRSDATRPAPDRRRARGSARPHPPAPPWTARPRAPPATRSHRPGVPAPRRRTGGRRRSRTRPPRR